MVLSSLSQTSPIASIRTSFRADVEMPSEQTLTMFSTRIKTALAYRDQQNLAVQPLWVVQLQGCAYNNPF